MVKSAAVACLPLFIYASVKSTMKLITAHKILISSSVVFFIFFALWELRNYSAGDSWAGFRGVLYLLVALGFGIYLKNFKRWYK